jgi:hypothetical protein
MVGRAVKRLAEEVQQLTGRSVELAYVIRATLMRPQPTRRPSVSPWTRTRPVCLSGGNFFRDMMPEPCPHAISPVFSDDGLVIRKDLSGRLRHVEYFLSDQLGLAVLQLICTLAKWGGEYLPHGTNAPE